MKFEIKKMSSGFVFAKAINFEDIEKNENFESFRRGDGKRIVLSTTLFRPDLTLSRLTLEATSARLRNKRKICCGSAQDTPLCKEEVL